MAKIGNLSEWISKELSEKPQISQKDSEMLLNKFMQSQQSLKSQIVELEKEIDSKNQEINLMSVDFEPHKSNLLLKISLMCEKLQKVSSEGFEAWIHEIEVARLKARYNESTILNLEQSLKSYKGQILDLENKLRCFGVDPGDDLTCFDFNVLLKNLFTVEEQLNSLIEKSEKNVTVLDLIMGNPSRSEEFKARLEIKTESTHKDLSGVAKAINAKLAEISDKIGLAGYFQSEQQGALSYLKERGVVEIEKILKNSLKTVKNFAQTLEMVSKTGHSQWKRELIKEKNESSGFKSIKEMGSLLQELEKVSREIVLADKFDQISSIKEVSRALMKAVHRSEATLIDMSKVFSVEYHSLLNERSLIIQQSGLGIAEELSFITKMSKLLKKHEKFKQNLIQPLAGLKTQEVHFLDLYSKKRLAEDKILKKLALMGKVQLKDQQVNSIFDAVELEAKSFELMQECFSSLPDFHSILLKTHENTQKLQLCLESLRQLQSYIAPGDLTIKESIIYLQSQSDSDDLIQSLSSHSNSLVKLSSILSDLYRSLPPCYPSTTELESINKLMNESNLTIDILVKFYQKGEKYKKLVENSSVPQLGPWLERNFADRWQFMLDYLHRVAEVGTQLEVVKRQVMEDNIDFSRVKGTWEKSSKNLMRSERALARLVEVCPNEEAVEELGSKLSKISKNRAQNVRNLRSQNPSGLIVQDNLDNLADCAQELSEVLEGIAGILAGADKQKGSEDGEMLIEYKPLPLTDPEDVKEMCTKALRNLIFTQNLLIGTELAEQDLNEKIKRGANEVSSVARTTQYLNEQGEELKILRKRLNDLTKLEEIKDGEVKVIQQAGERLTQELKTELENLRKDKNDLGDLAKKHESENSELLEKLKRELQDFKNKEIILQKRIDDLTCSVRELENHKNEVENKLKNSEQHENELGQKLKNAERQNLELNENMTNITNEKKKSGEGLQSNLNQKENEIEFLTKNLSNIEKERQDLKDTSINLQNQLGAANKEIEDLKAKLIENEKNSQNFKNNLNSLESENNSVKIECAKIPGLLSEIESLKNNLSLIKSENEALSNLSKASRKESKSSSSSSDEEKEQLNKEKAQDFKSEITQIREYYTEVLQNMQQKVGEILIKTDFVGDTLIEILPEEKLKEKMDRFQQQFEEVVKRNPSEDCSAENNLFELLDLLDKYESANGEQSSRLAGSSTTHASQDMENLSKGSKNSLSMKNKKNLRSGRPAVAPMNSFKNSLDQMKTGLAEVLINFSNEKLQGLEEFSEETEYYTTITRKFTEFSKEIIKVFRELKELEIEREKIIMREVQEFTQLVDSDNLGQLEVIRETYAKELVTEEQSISNVIMNCRLKLGVEKEMSKIRLQSASKKAPKANDSKITESLFELSKKSLETLKILLSPEELLKIKETSFNFSGLLLEEQIFDCCKNLANLESIKQEQISKINDPTFLFDFLGKLQGSIHRNSVIVESLWQFFIKVLGRDSDKAYLRQILLSLPSVEIENSKKGLLQSLEIFEDFLAKNEKKLQELPERQEDLISLAADNEESIDEAIRKLIKDLGSLDDDRSKKDLAAIKEEFEGTSEKSSFSLQDKNGHINQGFIQLSKLQNLARRQLETLKKSLKKLENDLLVKTSELENLNSQFEQERETFKDLLNIAETSAKETRILCNKYSNELSSKEMEIAALSNSKSDLLLDIESKDGEISQLSDEISDLKASARTSRANLKEKNDEIMRLEEQITELQARPINSTDQSQLEPLKSEIQVLINKVHSLEKELEQTNEDLLIVKRDKILVGLDLKKSAETIKELREEMGKIKAKIMITENSARELEEKNRLGVDRNDQLISAVLQQLQEYKIENEILNRQMRPAMNYRRLYSGAVSESDINKQSAEQLKIKMQDMESKLKEVFEINKKLQHENTMMEKFKNEWLELRSECEVLQAKVSSYESSEVHSEGSQTALEKFTKNLKEVVNKNLVFEEDKLNLAKALNDSNEMIKLIRKRNAFFKVLMIGRIKCYYRFSAWRRVIEVPENLKLEDPDLVCLYTVTVNAAVPSNCDPQASLHIKQTMQRALLDSPVRAQYKKYPVKSDQLPKNVLFKFFYEFLLEKAEFDSRYPENSKTIASEFLQKLKDKFGTTAEALKFLGEFLPSLYYLYQSQSPLSVLFCKLLNYLDPTPICGANSTVILEALLQLEDFIKLTQDSEIDPVKLETLGIINFDQALDLMHKLFGSNTEFIFLASSQFDKSLKEITGVEFLLKLSEGLVAIKNKQTMKVLEVFGQRDGLGFEDFEVALKKLRPSCEPGQVENFYFAALKGSDDFSKVTVNGLLNSLESSKTEGFFIGAFDVPSNIKEEVKAEDKFLSNQKSLTSESETLIHKKTGKKKLSKKKS